MTVTWPWCCKRVQDQHSRFNQNEILVRWKVWLKYLEQSLITIQPSPPFLTQHIITFVLLRKVFINPRRIVLIKEAFFSNLNKTVAEHKSHICVSYQSHTCTLSLALIFSGSLAFFSDCFELLAASNSWPLDRWYGLFSTVKNIGRLCRLLFHSFMV